MDKKSFIRGFGIGVLFSVAVLGISGTIRTSDSFVRSRAGELGMVEASNEEESLFTSASPETTATAKPKASSATKKTKENAGSSAKPTATSEGKATKTPENSSKPSATSASKKSSNTDMKSEKERLEKDLKNEEKKLTISNGEWSSDVSKKLEDMGIVDDSKDFDKYLNDNGYSGTITSGTYNVSVDDTYAELAKKITGK